MDPLDIFAANVRRLRLERELTQEGLAHASGLHMTDIARIETQGREPGVRVVVKIASGLGVEVGELFAGIKRE